MSDIGFFIDGAYLSIAWRNVSTKQIDFTKLQSVIEAKCAGRIAEAYCFDATENGRTNEYFKAMQRAGIRVKLYEYAYQDVYDEERKQIFDGNGYPIKRRIQKGVDVGLATHMLESHRRRRWSTLVLAAADADFAEPVQRLVEIYAVELTLLGIRGRASHALCPYSARTLDLHEIAASIECATQVIPISDAAQRSAIA